MDKADAYHEAMNTHRHYDTLSSAIISLLGTVVVGTPALYLSIKDLPGSWLIFAFSSLIIYFALQVYGRFDRWATIALNVAALIESGEEPTTDAKFFGFAHAFKYLGKYPQIDARPGGKVYNRLRFIGYSAIVIHLLLLVFLCGKAIGLY
jgi:hypothetical protein